jgi:hypothetical protein
LFQFFSARLVSCFGLFDIEGKPQYTYIVGKQIFNMHSPQIKRPEKAHQRLPFIPFSKAHIDKLYIFQ